MNKVRIFYYLCFIIITSQRITLWITEKCCETLTEEKRYKTSFNKKKNS